MKKTTRERRKSIVSFDSVWEKGYNLGIRMAGDLDWSLNPVCRAASMIAKTSRIPQVAKLAGNLEKMGTQYDSLLSDNDLKRLVGSFKSQVMRMGPKGVLGFLAGLLEDANEHRGAGWMYKLTEDLFPETKTAGDPDEHDWQQGHSGLLRTRPDYGGPDDEIIEEDELEEWLNRDQVAAICPSCADKMDEKGICRIKSSVIHEARTAAERQSKSKTLRTKVEDNHGEQFSATLVDKSGGTVLELESDGKTFGKWSWYVKTLMEGRMGDELYLDFGQGWYVTGMKKLMKEVEQSLTLRVAGILRDPDRVRREMKRNGIEMGRNGEVYFYPLSPIGIPLPSETPFKVKDIEAAVRQTAHVRDSNEEKMGRFKKLLDRLSYMKKVLEHVNPEQGMDSEGVLDVFKEEIQPLIPNFSRSPITKQIRDELDDLYDDIAGGSFSNGIRTIKSAQQAIEEGIEMWGKQIESWMSRRQLIMAIRNLLSKYPDLSPALVTASRTAASRPDIGPGVELIGKQGIYKVTFGPSELRETEGAYGGYNRMKASGFTHWLRLESPRGKDFEFYIKEGDRDTLYWYKNHRTLVPMKFKNAKLPPDIKELARKFPNDRELGSLYNELQKFMLELIDSGMPQAAKVADMLRAVLRDMEEVARSIGEARGAMHASRTASKKVIKIDWNDEKSISDAERQKSRLENQGYTLLKSIGGLSTSELIYVMEAASGSLKAGKQMKRDV